MVSLMAFCKDMKELMKLKKTSKECAANVSNDKWVMEFYNRIDEVTRKVMDGELMDIVCFDLGEDEGISYARYLRRCYEKAYMILMADKDMSPMDYIRPDIMPSGLIVSPATQSDMKKVFMNVFETYMDNIRKKGEEKIYVVSNMEGLTRIPYSKIQYIESRNKRVYIRYDNKEIGFCSTMDKLEEELGDEFIRTHRSFLVRRENIRKVYLTKQIIVMRDDLVVPISRKYKPNLKEFLL